MPDLYLDENISPKAVAALQRVGHTAVHGRAVRKAAPDYLQLALAASQGRTFVTADHDFILLHNIWHHWPRLWGYPPPPDHAGILILPNGWAPDRLATVVHEFFQGGRPTTSRLWQWPMVLAKWIELPLDPV